jgi:glycerate 2-kinase
MNHALSITEIEIVRHMKVVIASDSFKGCCSSIEAAAAFESGIRAFLPDASIVTVPVADGGEGTVQALVSGLGGTMREIEVTGPLGWQVKASYGIINNVTAIMEMSAASGLSLVPEDKRNPLITTSFGTGEMIRDAMHIGCKKIYIGIGGSATNDGGMGMAQALGVSFLDKENKELGFGGKVIGELDRIDLSHRNQNLLHCEIVALCDVSNPLCGETGASYVYGPQKGANALDVLLLDAHLKHYSEVIMRQTGKDVAHVPGAGAAGGLGAGLLAFCNATLKPGIETVLEVVQLEKHLADADLVITGEGRIDGQSCFGKVPVGVAKVAKKYNIPVIAIVGSIGDGAEAVYELGIDGIVSIANGPATLEDSIKNFHVLAKRAAESIMRIRATNE